VQQWTALARKYQAKPMASTLRTDTPAGSTEKSALTLAHESYQQGKYREVLQVLQNAPVDEDVQYLQANALFQLNRFAAAEPLFQALLSSFQYKHEARWNRFLCQLANATLHSDQVRKQASIMAGDEGFELRDKARQLLKELDAMGAVNK
jgi:tetratricopeptide (TPR) repeat protein